MAKYFNVMKNEQFSDVTFSIGDKELKAHKLILSIHSPVFAAMFKHDTKEAKENRVEIIDIHFDVFQELLKFIYSGKAVVLDFCAAELLAAADKVFILKLFTN